MVHINTNVYLCAKEFDDVTHATTGDHYELYLMPQNKDLIKNFNAHGMRPVLTFFRDIA